MKLRSVLLIIAGLFLVFWATSRAAAELLPALQPTSTPDETVLQSFAPNTGPLSRPGIPGRVAASGETESEPVTGTQTAPAPNPALTPVAPPVSATTVALQAVPNTLAGPASPTSDPNTEALKGLEGLYLGGPVMPRPTAAPTQTQPLAIPDRIVIPAIDLDAPVVPGASQRILIGTQEYYQWLSPDKFAAGWHTDSATLGLPGNTVLDGHQNVFGKVFGRLVDLKEGDKIRVFSGSQVFRFVVVNKMILKEAGVPIEQRLENARWIGQSDDIRLTLITCWPATNNTHRLIIVAVPDPSNAN